MSEFHSEWGHGWQPAPQTNLNPKQFAPHIQYAVPTGDKPFGNAATHYGLNIAGVELRTQAPDSDKPSETLGHLHWSSKRGEILDVHVVPGARRKGVATALYKAAKDIAAKTGVPEPVHSNDRSDQGDAWAKSTGEPLPERMKSIRE
jgi:GNAT superfamily N-acetyltransferase